MSFEFIDNKLSIDQAARKQIRRHAAKGKNKGKIIVRSSRKHASTTTISSFGLPGIIRKGPDPAKESSQIERPIDDGLVFPVPLFGESKALVKRVVGFLCATRYVPQLSKALDSAGQASSMFVRYIFIDQACFHCAVATSILCLNNLVTRPDGILQAMSHISHTFRLLNQRLSLQEEISDTTMAVIVSMAQYERHQNQYRRGFVHVQALRRMVQLQGGLLQVSKSHHILVQKMLRVDLEYALQLGSSTLFSLEDAISENRIINELYGDNRHKHAGSSNSYQSPLIGSLRRDIQDIFIEVTSLASMLNDATNGVGPKLKSCAFHSDLLVLGYRLGNMYTLGGCRPKCPIENAIHLGLTAFLITFLPGLDHRIAHNALLSNLLLSVAQDLADDGLDIREILLWMLYIGAASSSQLGTHPTWISKSKETIDTLKLRTWEQVQDVLAKYPWVNAVHDTAGKTLWHQSRVNSLPKN
ncbi:hypothetical protein IFM58399_06857 [Aspergillus lentulus]|uniref:Uncharacterized protein n=1 Tax=Aspergillus lentulus TaxID=293939 RepID=A0ABQ0ZSM0_ASPLE|nr:uncharacterized protein IFM58399_06857 [Aspergillus lentulus]KAF4160178.1 hypothetical protein CNMCM6069_009249 [Aspergillus lentulus]KAF4170093.1 hypothetical protein CNMCM6936_005238 [Aspergillus lentulus]KAF4181405.1 hypothetical protein CNMCM7927_000641 [Aspergillus lentulus]KAF4181781.1 hypothetical protein CNMCM8060_008152 [Aspergillus lentulus]KAF4198175.1 hypothetical protein CNMCM8694_000859 [Aspergillus lentulus]